jgi:PIN domain nuclease of toxin-antitoxin system
VRVLLDTHSLLWWTTSSPWLSEAAFLIVSDERSEVFVSAATAWEIATKFRLGKLPEAGPLVQDFIASVFRDHFLLLAVEVKHGLRAGLLQGEHKDPFDRMLIAQALEEDLTLVSNETAFDKFGVKRLW